MSTKHYSHPKAIRGPGGMKCHCCRWYSLAETKKMNARLIRRRARQDLRIEAKAA
jgi:hypothetical protein